MNYGTKNETWTMGLVPPHINTVSYPTTTPPLNSPQQKKVGHYSEASFINKIP